MRDKVWAYIIGTSLVLFAIHNPLQPLKEYLFLPVIGLAFGLLATIVVLQDNKEKITLGHKGIYIPLMIIVASIAISGFVNGQGLAAKVTPALFGAFMFGVYLASRILGSRVFVPFTWAVIIGSLGIIAFGFINQGIKTGGYIFSPTNYDIATGFLVFGLLVSSLNNRWWLSSIALVGLFFTGAEEGLFATAVVLVIILIRRDWSKKILLPVSALVVTIIACSSIGITQALYFPTVEKTAQAKEAIEETPIGKALDKVIPNIITTPIDKALPIESPEEFDELLNEATGHRWIDHWRIPPIKPFGYGYNINSFYQGIPHNVPLIITHQIGIVATIAWLWIVIYCAFKTKWKYAWIGLIALSVFDHFIWTQAAPWFWALAGVSSAHSTKSDYIFKGGK